MAYSLSNKCAKIFGQFYSSTYHQKRYVVIEHSVYAHTIAMYTVNHKTCHSIFITLIKLLTDDKNSFTVRLRGKFATR